MPSIPIPAPRLGSTRKDWVSRNRVVLLDLGMPKPAPLPIPTFAWGRAISVEMNSASMPASPETPGILVLRSLSSKASICLGFAS
ncbi:hypothetical protein C4D60_Mb07t06300 [Musa balbisiana]|uniref:Uncharacterized protein n=1 Tax=Musa balbisiana TaxID=52838 RepID=A0A4S8JDC2_MUSBA|nr:hypothetical protein C4D60_Mb07t06300 [Musa balbisiana]